MAKRFLTPLQLATLDEPPANPVAGQIYFDTFHGVIKAFNGQLWYDVAGPREILEHTHDSSSGLVDTVEYANYVDDFRIIADNALANSSFIEQIIDGGGASGN